MKLNTHSLRKALLALSTAVFIFCTAISLCIPTETASGEQRVLRAGFFAFNGYHEMDSEGNRYGYGYELLQRIAACENISYEYVGYAASWDDMLDMLEKGEIDLVSSARKTPARLQRFDFSERNIGSNLTMMTIKAGNTRIAPGNYDDYNGMTVGMLTGNSRNASFDDFSKQHGFTYTPKYYESTAALHQALVNDEIDAAVSSSLRSTKGEWIIASFDEAPVYIITRKGDTQTMALVDDALKKMDLYDIGWRLKLNEKYYGDSSGTEIHLTPNESA